MRFGYPTLPRGSAMQLLSLTCNHCGAPLEVSENAKFVTCTHCASRLAVQRSGGAAYTEVLEALEQRTEQIADDVESLKLQSELDRLDREWMLERDRYMVQDKHGRRRFPSKTGSIIVMVLVIGFTLVWMAMASSSGPLVALFGLLFIAGAVWVFTAQLRRAHQYERRRQQYERRREQLLRRIESRSP